MEICQYKLDRLDIEANVLDSIITGGESWVLEYDPLTKRQILEWHTKRSPRLKKAYMSRSKMKAIIIAFLTAVAFCTRNLYLPRSL
ncbi:histone-lysine n-methyltransferase setmar-like protein [Nephila pilipes]|uniref:Histone-lysine n-methyltransferase setmar-like protein n=1 Tax=Nephila pilipes TaxID=299642 RepID=A0A8X6N3M6_NEPPI|nr:histone-lysine n-methyltransferase setmar-like protein [Nephila pilipes]